MRSELPKETYTLHPIRNSNLYIASGYSDDESASAVGVHFRSLWNHLRFGWSVNIPPKFSSNEPIHFLGRRYLCSKLGRLTSLRGGSYHGLLDAFYDDFTSRINFTYRDNFEPIPVFRLAKFSANHVSWSDSKARSGISPVMPMRHGQGWPQKPRALLASLPKGENSFSFRVQNPLLKSHSIPDEGRESRTHTIPLSVRTSDCGWGCTLRSGQMLIAQALSTHLLGRDWVCMKNGRPLARETNAILHRQLIRWFGDTSSRSSPLSIHNLVAVSGLPPGTWFGPTSTCSALLMTAAFGVAKDPLLSGFEVYLARDRIICLEEVMELFETGLNSENCGSFDEYRITDHTGNYCRRSGKRSCIFHASTASIGSVSSDRMEGRCYCRSRTRNSALGLLLLVPMRLGAGRLIDAAYHRVFLRLLKDPACVGVIGGRPKHCVYIAGVQGDRVIYFDPHYCQEAINVQTDSFSTESWHCLPPKLMGIRHLDPASAFGFYCGSAQDLRCLLERLPQLSRLHPQRATNGDAGIDCSSQPLLRVLTGAEARALFQPLNNESESNVSSDFVLITPALPADEDSLLNVDAINQL